MAKSKKTQYAILGALSVFPMSGYDIKKWIIETTGSFWAESPGQVYPVLAEMEQAGLVKCDATQGQGKRIKKVYTITKQGKVTLKEWLRKPAEPMVIRDELCLKLFYGKNLTDDECCEHIKRHQKQCEEDLIRYQAIEKHIKSNHATDPDSYYWLTTLRGAILHRKADLKWCQFALRRFKNKKRG